MVGNDWAILACKPACRDGKQAGGLCIFTEYPEILTITEVFLNIRYGRESNAEDFDKLKRLIKAFRI